MKKKTGKSKKDGALKASFEHGVWKTEHINPEQVLEMFEEIQKETAVAEETRLRNLSIHPKNLVKLSMEGSARICVVVAEKLYYEVGKDQKSFKMEAGRIAAQAAHAVSKLKLQYINVWAKEGPESYEYLVSLMTHQPITTIVLGARDNNEVAHIADLAEKAGMLHTTFCDDNVAVYGTDSNILTAVAIGPHCRDAFTGISDYLPLYKAAGEL